MLLGWFTETDWLADFDTKVEELPGCFMIQREIKKALAGQDFFFYDFYGDRIGKPIRVQGTDIEAFNYYFTVWDDFHYLRMLPHGRGTLAERRWVVDIIKVFEKAHMSTKNFIEEQEARAIERAYKRGGKNNG